MSDNQPRSGSLDKTQVIVALLALIGVVITAACGFFGVILPQLNQGPSQPEIQATLDVLRTRDSAATALSLTTAAFTVTPAATQPPPTPSATSTDVPTHTATHTTVLTATPTQTQPPTLTPVVASATATAVIVTAVPPPQSVTLAAPSVELLVIIARGTLTLYMPQSVSLNGLMLVAVDQRPFVFTDRFDSLQLTGGIAPADSCYILRSPEGVGEPLPGVCANAAVSGRISIININAVDNFWFDGISMQQNRTLAVQVGDAPLTDADGNRIICPGGQPTCTFAWTAVNVPATPTPVVLVATVPSNTGGYPCDAQIIDYGGQALLNVVRGGPNTQSSMRPPVQQRLDVQILDVRSENRTTYWYQISDSTGVILGWTLPEYLTFSLSCPIIPN
ncbi:MAG: hypothetical protein J0M33_14525 [Anaerolineae bacterium]|nr:hypothetical protein [Anaerolineae bacterium]